MKGQLSYANLRHVFVIKSHQYNRQIWSIPSLLSARYPAQLQCSSMVVGSDTTAPAQDQEEELETLAKQCDELKAKKQRLLSELIQTERQVSCCAHP